MKSKQFFDNNKNYLSEYYYCNKSLHLAKKKKNLSSDFIGLVFSLNSNLLNWLMTIDDSTNVQTWKSGWNLSASSPQHGYSPIGRVEFLNWMLGNSGSPGWNEQNSSM